MWFAFILAVVVAWALFYLASGLFADALLWRQARKHKKRQKTLKLRIVARTDYTEDKFELVFEAKRRKRLRPFLAGQYLTLHIPYSAQRAIQRSYSLASWEKSPVRYMLCIKFESQGKGSGWLHEHAHVGTTLDVHLPQGQFVLPPTTRPLVLVAGGIGITPIRAMLEELLHKTPDRCVWIVYAARTIQDLVYHELFKSLAAKYPHFTYIPCLTKPTADWQGWQGRLSAPRLFELPPLGAEAEYAFCASATMMEELMSGLQQLGVPPAQLHHEAFGQPPVGVLKHPANIVIDGTDYGTMQAGTIYSFLEESSCQLGGGCRSGHCKGCKMLLLSGSVAWLDPTAQAGLPSQVILPCVCTPEMDLHLVQA